MNSLSSKNFTPALLNQATTQNSQLNFTPSSQSFTSFVRLQSQKQIMRNETQQAESIQTTQESFSTLSVLERAKQHLNSMTNSPKVQFQDQKTFKVRKLLKVTRVQSTQELQQQQQYKAPVNPILKIQNREIKDFSTRLHVVSSDADSRIEVAIRMQGSKTISNKSTKSKASQIISFENVGGSIKPNKVQLAPVRNRILEAFQRWMDFASALRMKDALIARLAFKNKIKQFKRKLLQLFQRRRERIKQQLRDQSANTIKKYLEGYAQRMRVKTVRECILILQKNFRKTIVSRRYRKTLKFVKSIQAQMRGYLTQKKFRKALRAIIKIQTLLRKAAARLKVKKIRAAIKIQSLFKMIAPKKTLQRHLELKRKREAAQQLILSQKSRAEALKRQREAVRIIEKFWGIILIRRDLKEKKKLWKNLPLDCRLLWLRFSALKEQAFDLKEEIRYLNNKKKKKETDKVQ